jgi:anti-sigma factor RsiW
MPECSRIVALLSDYLDNRLSPDVRRDLEQHIGGCGECATFVESFRSTISLLQSLREDELPDELRLRLKAFLDGRSNS